jgi:hypothetical protein
MKCFIYRIQDNNDPEQFYIGSTLNLSRRKSHHKKNVRNKVGKLYWCKLYQYIRDKGGWDNFTFSKTHEIEINKLTEGTGFEQSIIDEFKPPLNSIKASIKPYKEILL